LYFRTQLEERNEMLDLQNKTVGELQSGLTDKNVQEQKISELQESLQSMERALNGQSEKTTELEKELEETLEKLERETREKEKLQNNVKMFSQFSLKVCYFLGSFEHFTIRGYSSEEEEEGKNGL